MYVDDFVVATLAEVSALDADRAGRSAFAVGPPLYGDQARQETRFTRRCAYPRCRGEAGARCGTCKRLYCAAHCSYLVFGPTGKRQECELCRQHVTLDWADAPKQRGAAAGFGAIVALLALVGLGLRLDIATGGRGVVAFLTFGAAFVAFVLYLL